jgi:hypothetical protein
MASPPDEAVGCEGVGALPSDSLAATVSSRSFFTSSFRSCPRAKANNARFGYAPGLSDEERTGQLAG